MERLLFRSPWDIFTPSTFSDQCFVAGWDDPHRLGRVLHRAAGERHSRPGGRGQSARGLPQVGSPAGPVRHLRGLPDAR